MHFTCTARYNPATGTNDPYYRLKETYRDCAGVVRSRILLSPGFITELSGAALRKVSEGLTYLMEHRGQMELWEDFLSEQPEMVTTLIKRYWSMMVSKGTIDVNHQKDLKRIEKERNLIYGSTLEHQEGREIGGEWLCLQAIRQLGLEEFLRSQGWEEQKIKFAIAHLITRTLYSPSEYKSLRIMQENSAVMELLGLDISCFNKHNIYSVAPSLYALKDALETHLCRTTDRLFDLTNAILLFDLTNFYFEGRKEESRKAKFGRSKEKRNDCKLLVLALCINAEGFIRYSSVLEGNTADPAALPDMVEQLVTKNPMAANPQGKALVVIDAGISTEENLALIKEKGYNYLCVSRKKLTDYELKEDARSVVVHDNKKREIKLTQVNNPSNGDYYLKIDSPLKALKEESMSSLFQQRFEDGLKGIETSLTKKGGTKKYDKVCQRVGRLIERYPSVGSRYEIIISHDQKDKTTHIQWYAKEGAEKEYGTYFLRTNILHLDEKTTWSYYNLIREIEASNRQLKLDLNLRPIYHQTDENSDAHIFFGLMAYWIVNTIRYQLKQTGMNAYWTEIVRIMSTQKAVTTTATNKIGEQVELRMCTNPTKKAAEIYDKLKYRRTPFKKMKICSTQT